MDQVTYCIRVRYTKDLRLVTLAKKLVNFANSAAAAEFLARNTIIDKAYVHQMIDENDWFDYKSIKLSTLQQCAYKHEYAAWVKI